MDLTPKAEATKTVINKWNYSKIKICCTTKETIDKMKRPPTEWERIFANHVSDKGLIPKIYFKNLHKVKSNPPPQTT